MLQLQEVLEDFRKYSRMSEDEIVNVVSRNSRGETPLHYMAIIGDQNAIHLLCSAGADVNACDMQGSTPLWHAVFNVQKTAVSALIDFGADPDIPNDRGESPRHMICSCANLQWMRALIK